MPYKLLENIFDLEANTILYNAQKTSETEGYLLLSPKEDGDYPFYTIPTDKVETVI